MEWDAFLTYVCRALEESPVNRLRRCACPTREFLPTAIQYLCAADNASRETFLLEHESRVRQRLCRGILGLRQISLQHNASGNLILSYYGLMRQQMEVHEGREPLPLTKRTEDNEHEVCSLCGAHIQFESPGWGRCGHGHIFGWSDTLELVRRV